ncbi:MAG: hypothetical protein K6U87_08405 [Firmicutes bacterium]|nr:hypothetical protein [Bacillota bacterium]
MPSILAATGSSEQEAEVTRGVRRVLYRALAVLWLIDAFLQMQPGMFTMDMVSTIMQPTLSGQPPWLAAADHWAIQLVTPAVGWWNWGFAGIQFAIAFLLWSPKVRWVRLGLWVSIGWGVLVWLFGEGLGGVLTGSATLLAGGPGSVLLYVWIAILLLLPDRRWHLSGRWSLVRDGAALVWGWATLQQLVPGYWNGIGLSSVFQSNASMQPHWLVPLIAPVVAIAAKQPVVVNFMLVATMALTTGFAFGPRPRRWALGLGGALLAFAWVFGQGFGMIFTGMGTDPNTAPLLAVLMYPAWAWAAQLRRPRQAAHPHKVIPHPRSSAQL